jgi:cell division protease FtsH
MSDTLGMVQLAPRQNNWVGPAALGAKPYSEETAKLIDSEVARIIKECHEDAKRLLGEHRASLDALVAALMQRESLDEKEILAVTGLPAAPLLPDRPSVPDPTEEVGREPVTGRSVSSRGRRRSRKALPDDHQE